MGKTKETIRQIVVNYSALIIECGLNPEFKKKFYNDPVPYLNDQVGMKFPEQAKKLTVNLDPKTMRWPVITVFFPEPIEIDGKKVWSVTFNEAVEIRSSRSRKLAALETQEILQHFDLEPLTALPEAMQAIVPRALEQGAAHAARQKPGKKVVKEVPFPIEDCGVHLDLPFIDVDVDILEEIQFDDAEIALTACT
jgi:hypothetical protein